MQQFRWDPDNQLTEARVTRRLNGQQHTRVTRYTYDPLGRRLAKLNAQGKPRQYFLWDGNRLLMEAAPDGKSRLYLYEPDSFVPMAAVEALANTTPGTPPGTPAVPTHASADPDASASPEPFATELSLAKATLNTPPRLQLAHTRAMGRHVKDQAPTTEASGPPPRPHTQRIVYYHCDHLGTPQEVTDSNGRLLWAAHYAAWGKVRRIDHGPHTNWPTDGNTALAPSEPDPAANEACFSQPFEQPLRFQGQYFDPETGLHYNRFRYYDPDCGRFVSLDPIGLDGGTNLFQYAPNPSGWVDPLGLTKYVVIGEGQTSVETYAAALRNSDKHKCDEFRTITNEWVGLMQKSGASAYKRGSPDWESRALNANADWIVDRNREGYVFIDIGTDGAANRSAFYAVEKQTLHQIEAKVYRGSPTGIKRARNDSKPSSRPKSKTLCTL